MKKKLFVLVAILVVAIGVGVAYAWWTADGGISGNTVTTGGMSLATSDTAINATGLVPQNAPGDEAAAGYYAKFIWVQNTGSVDEMFYAWLDNASGDGVLLDAVKCAIWLAPTDAPGDWALTGSLGQPGPWPVYTGTLRGLYGEDVGKWQLKTVSPGHTATPLHPGQYAIYKIVVWLDGPSAGPDTMNKSLSVDLKFKAFQSENWPLGL